MNGNNYEHSTCEFPIHIIFALKKPTIILNYFKSDDVLQSGSWLILLFERAPVTNLFYNLTKKIYDQVLKTHFDIYSYFTQK